MDLLDCCVSRSLGVWRVVDVQEPAPLGHLAVPAPLRAELVVLGRLWVVAAPRRAWHRSQIGRVARRVLAELDLLLPLLQPVWVGLLAPLPAPGLDLAPCRALGPAAVAFAS